MPRKPIEFAEWRPDIALVDTQFAFDAENVFAGLNSYKPFPGLLPFTASPLPGRPCGLTAARTSSGTWQIFGGTDTKLFKWTHSGWVDVSRTTGGAYDVPIDALWSFEQSGTKLVAVNINTVPQVIDIDAGGNFDALGGSPPRATNVKQIGDFLFLSGLATPTPGNRTIKWSAINDITGWTVGLGLSDEQTFPDGGPVQGVAGSEIGYVVQDRAVRTMQFLPGDLTIIFRFTRVLQYRGCISKYGFITVANNLFMLGEDGFFSMAGDQLQPIGYDKVNDWFHANSDRTRWNMVQAISFPNKPMCAFAFHSPGSSQPIYDTMLIYNWSNQRWVHCHPRAYVWATLGTPDLDLDTTGTEVGDQYADSNALSLDSFAYVGGRPLVAGIDENSLLSSLTGPNMRAIVETAELHSTPGQRTFVSDVYPIVDAPDATVSVATRERLQEPVVFSSPISLEPMTGGAFIYSSARLHRFRVTVPAGQTWTHGQGIVANVDTDGEGVP